jgi:hypothetical protein
MKSSTSTDALVQLQSRLHRLERRNRQLIFAIGICAALGCIAAGRPGAKVIDADEIRVQRMTLVDLQGKICSYHQGSNGMIIEGGPITDYPALTPRPEGAPVISHWKHGIF